MWKANATATTLVAAMAEAQQTHWQCHHAWKITPTRVHSKRVLANDEPNRMLNLPTETPATAPSHGLMPPCQPGKQQSDNITRPAALHWQQRQQRQGQPTNYMGPQLLNSTAMTGNDPNAGMSQAGRADTNWHSAPTIPVTVCYKTEHQ